MTKALFRKQLMELNAWLYQDKKSGKRRSRAGVFLCGILYLAICVFLGGVFFAVGCMLCEPLVAAGMGWLYFAIMGLMAMALGVFGSVFNTFASLYQAKDNDLLLSLPIPPSQILLMRLSGVFFWGFFYEALVMIPTLLVYMIKASPGVVSIICSVLLVFVIAFFILTLSCVLGWIVAGINARLKHKSILTVILSLAFLGGYYYVYFRAYEMLQQLLANCQSVGTKIRGLIYPVYLMGRAAEGSVPSMLLFTAMVMGLFALVYLVLSRSFLRLATTNHATAKKTYRPTMIKRKSADGALLFKEMGRFVSSPTYMLNCALGTLMFLCVSVLILCNSAYVRRVFGEFNGREDVALLICCALICMLAAMNDITAPSISLEGKSIWLAQVLPVTPWMIFKAKLQLHLLITVIPTMLCAVILEIVLQLDILSALLLILLPLLFILFSAAFGLMVNLKIPNLHWTDETAPVKQSMGVVLVMFAGWAFVVALGGLYFAVRTIVGAKGYLIICAVLFVCTDAVLLRWLKTKGARIFETL